MNSTFLPSTVDRVPESTAPGVNARIAQHTQERVRKAQLYGREGLDRRIEELDREWDVERVLEANAATLALAGVVLGAAVDRRFLVLPGLVAGFLLQHALQGWCPPVPLFRRLGIRTCREIEEERCALKSLRGDFVEIWPDSSVDQALAAAERR